MWEHMEHAEMPNYHSVRNRPVMVYSQHPVPMDNRYGSAYGYTRGVHPQYQQHRGRAQPEGICAALLGTLTCCCCLDMLLF